MALHRAEFALGRGDRIRITAGGTTKDGHRLDNGMEYEVAGFTKGGDIELSNGWTIGKDFGHLTHAYVQTSIAGQGKTVDRVMIAFGSESKPAINATTFYVAASRAREQLTIYSNMASPVLREAIQRIEPRKSAVELFDVPKPRKRVTVRERAMSFMKRMKDAARQLCDRAFGDMGNLNERDYGYGRT